MEIYAQNIRLPGREHMLENRKYINPIYMPKIQNILCKGLLYPDCLCDKHQLQPGDNAQSQPKIDRTFHVGGTGSTRRSPTAMLNGEHNP